MAFYLANVLYNASLWLIRASFGAFAGVVAGTFTRTRSQIDHHPYSKPSGAGELGSDMPPESIGRVEIEPLLEPRRAGRRRRRR